MNRPALAGLCLAGLAACSGHGLASEIDAGGDGDAGPDAAPPSTDLDCTPYWGVSTAEWSEDLALCAMVGLSSNMYEAPGSLNFASLTTADLECFMEAGDDPHESSLCLGGADPADFPCGPDSPEWSCVGDNVVYCGSGQSQVESCPTEVDIWAIPAGGPTCVYTTDFGGYAWCGAEGTCADGDTRCDGNWYLECDAGDWTGLDCADYGWTCTHEGGPARCTDGTNVACGGDDEGIRCEGDLRVDCKFGRELRHDCARIEGEHCVTTDGVAVCGFDDECYYYPAECLDGHVYRFCAAGVKRTVDCRTLGFDGCGGDVDLEDPHCVSSR